MGRKALDLTMQNFGFLLAVELWGHAASGAWLWRCICQRDGNECYVPSGDLRYGRTKSCGCLAGVPAKGRGLPQKRECTPDALRYLYLEKMLSTCEIGAMFGVNASTAWSWLKKFDIPIRSLSSARKLGIKRGRINPKIGLSHRTKESMVINGRRLTESLNNHPDRKKILQANMKKALSVHIANSRNRKIEKICEFDGKAFLVPPHLAESKYCCRAHYIAARKREAEHRKATAEALKRAKADLKLPKRAKEPADAPMPWLAGEIAKSAALRGEEAE